MGRGCAVAPCDLASPVPPRYPSSWFAAAASRYFRVTWLLCVLPRLSRIESAVPCRPALPIPPSAAMPRPRPDPQPTLPPPFHPPPLRNSGGGGGGGGGGGDGSGGGGGRGDSPDDDSQEGSDGEKAELLSILAGAGVTMASLPAELNQAVVHGKISPRLLKNYLALRANIFTRVLLGINKGFRERLVADPGFIAKMSIELGIGLFTKSTAEWTKRGESFKRELDFVGANVVMALLADFMLVWLPAPVFQPFGEVESAWSRSRLGRYVSTCPGNCFQVVPKGVHAWSLGQRATAVARNFVKLSGVGFVCSMVGVGVTNLLCAIRLKLDPTLSFNPPQAPVPTSAIYGLYLATSSNVRYQMLAGFEERVVEVALRSNPALCTVVSFVLRTGNTFLGSLLWVDFIRLFGMQKAAVEEPKGNGKKGSSKGAGGKGGKAKAKK